MAARILIIDDNPENLELMTYLLGAFGHTMLKCTRRRETRPGNAARAAVPGGVKVDRRKTVS
jgi:CheY-like chemotaxis protein